MSSPDVDSLLKQHKASHSNNVLKSADEFSHQQGKQRLSTGSKNLDDLLGAGLETGAITQFYGASNTGKTHLCHLLCVVLPSPYKAIYIDTEGGFREESPIYSHSKRIRLDKYTFEHSSSTTKR